MADSSFEISRTSFPRRVPNDTSVINYNQLRSDSTLPDIGIQRVTVETEPEYDFFGVVSTRTSGGRLEPTIESE